MSSNSPLLGMIKDWINDPTPPTGGDIYEYRFNVSGIVFNGDMEGDPFKSEYGGLLMETPLPLWKVGYSYDDYPQELATWFRVRPVELNEKNIRSSHVPHEETAAEIGAILTLYFRRLVTVVGTVAVTLPTYYSKAPLRSPKPQPITLKAREARFWPRLPLTVITSGAGQHYKDPNPEILPVSPGRLRDFLLALATHKDAEKIVNAARLYHRAMENLFTHVDVSYLLLVCAADALASINVQSLSEDEILATSAAKNVAKAAKALGLNDAQIKTLSVATIPDPKKSKTRMFGEFLLQWGAGHDKLPCLLNPIVLDILKVGDEQAAIKLAYEARSGYVHHANAFAEIALTGTSSGMSPETFFAVMIGETCAPSILWLERLVAHAIQSYVKPAA